MKKSINERLSDIRPKLGVVPRPQSRRLNINLSFYGRQIKCAKSKRRAKTDGPTLDGNVTLGIPPLWPPLALLAKPNKQEEQRPQLEEPDPSTN